MSPEGIREENIPALNLNLEKESLKMIEMLKVGGIENVSTQIAENVVSRLAQESSKGDLNFLRLMRSWDEVSGDESRREEIALEITEYAKEHAGDVLNLEELPPEQ